MKRTLKNGDKHSKTNIDNSDVSAPDERTFVACSSPRSVESPSDASEDVEVSNEETADVTRIWFGGSKPRSEHIQCKVPDCGSTKFIHNNKGYCDTHGDEREYSPYADIKCHAMTHPKNKTELRSCGGKIFRQKVGKHKEINIDNGGYCFSHDGYPKSFKKKSPQKEITISLVSAEKSDEQEVEVLPKKSKEKEVITRTSTVAQTETPTTKLSESKSKSSKNKASFQVNDSADKPSEIKKPSSKKKPTKINHTELETDLSNGRLLADTSSESKTGSPRRSNRRSKPVNKFTIRTNKTKTKEKSDSEDDAKDKSDFEEDASESSEDIGESRERDSNSENLNAVAENFANQLAAGLIEIMKRFERKSNDD